ncbi:MAG: sugar MFS transporter [Paraglaciecola sp.]|uniref:sugar MFS transporter n=1 Tax=Paraglaciecola sp. TaxID=1920173 RepID=UPI00273FF121|nr:sugar MFS transporter [Paraglaciecola sp.]MDP5033018.1 sugar MFS transporter [Paraglaciecola sp.]MDP5133920.1 sugar MFS transporter [Paraglaciecola sp.]
MSSSSITTNTFTKNQLQDGYSFSLSVLTSLFFMWGFITCLNDILIPHLKAAFSLNYTQAMLIQFCFFGAYFFVSLPAGKLLKAIGYQKGIVVGLVIAAFGCLLFYPAAASHSYPLFLTALFVLASGITVLQVSANPYVSLLGPPETASSRLTLTQAFNSLGTTIAPYLGGLLILNEAVDSLANNSSAESVQMPYLVLVALLLLLAAIFAWIKLPHIASAEVSQQEKLEGSAWQQRHLVLGAMGIFVYVGAEVAIGSFLVNFLGESNIAALEEAEAAKYLSYYWGGAMLGRFIGAAAMQKVSGGKVLAFNAAVACLLLAITITFSGSLAMWALLLVGLCNSVMFPTIFCLAVNNLGKHTAQGSSILCLAIVGGAIIPLFQGILADSVGVQLAFILPLFCYLYIAYYGLFGSRVITKPSWDQ